MFYSTGAIENIRMDFIKKINGKFQIKVVNFEGKVVNEGSIILQNGLTGLQQTLKKSSKIWYCEVTTVKGQKYRVTGDKISSKKPMQIFQRLFDSFGSRSK